jgi:hypothetical protein
MKTVCDITNVPGYDIVLGIPWLCKHEPDIDWKTGQIRWRNNETIPEEGKEESGSQKPKIFLPPTNIPPQYVEKKKKDIRTTNAKTHCNLAKRTNVT